MKSPSIFLAIFVLAVPFLTFAQQTQRTPTPEQTLDFNRGRLTELENYAYRFEVAYQENELQSMEDIRVEIVKIMDAEVAQLEKRHSSKTALKTQTARRDLQKSLRKQFKDQTLLTFQNSGSTDRPAFFTQIDQFREQMQFELLDLQAELSQNRE